jgi:fumarate reductase subunit C
MSVFLFVHVFINFSYQLIIIIIIVVNGCNLFLHFRQYFSYIVAVSFICYQEKNFRPAQVTDKR